MGFESFPESVQTNLSKSPRNPQVICPVTWRASSLEVTDLFMMGPKFKVGSEPPEPQLKYLEKFPLVPTQKSNPEPPAWKSSVLPPEPPVLSSKIS